MSQATAECHASRLMDKRGRSGVLREVGKAGASGAEIGLPQSLNSLSQRQPSQGLVASFNLLKQRGIVLTKGNWQPGEI